MKVADQNSPRKEPEEAREASMWLWNRFLDFFDDHEEIVAWSLAIIGTGLMWLIGFALFYIWVLLNH